MIKLTRHGIYKLTETRNHTKILSLNNDSFAWVEPRNIGELLVLAHVGNVHQKVLSVGDFNLYLVDNEPDLHDMFHLELEVGADIWQGYLLLTGLPTKTHPRTRIVPTTELIAHSAASMTHPGHFALAK